jgi:hypothetical protein
MIATTIMSSGSENPEAYRILGEYREWGFKIIMGTMQQP